MKTIGQLADEYCEAKAVGLMLTPEEVLDCVLRATRYYAAYGNINSLSGTDTTPAAGDFPEEPEPTLTQSYPVKDLNAIDENTVVSLGEWAVITPLFNLYVEQFNATRLEASRGAGIDPFGRSSSEIQQDITLMENETLPQRAFSNVVITI